MRFGCILTVHSVGLFLSLSYSLRKCVIRFNVLVFLSNMDPCVLYFRQIAGFD